MIKPVEVMYMNRFKDDSGNAAFRLIRAVIPSLPFLGFRFFREYLRFKSTADRAGKIFYDELLAQGIGPVFEIYFEEMSQGSLVSMLRLCDTQPDQYARIIAINDDLKKYDEHASISKFSLIRIILVHHLIIFECNKHVFCIGFNLAAKIKVLVIPSNK